MGQEGYDKQEWKELEKAVYDHGELIESVIYVGYIDLCRITLCREYYDRAGNLVM